MFSRLIYLNYEIFFNANFSFEHVFAGLESDWVRKLYAFLKK